MRNPLRKRIAIVLFGILLGVGYIYQRDTGGSLLASVVGGYESVIGYTTKNQTIKINGQKGGEKMVDVFFMYDSEKVQFVGSTSPYTHIVKDDKISLVELQLSNLPTKRDQTLLASTQRKGSMDSVVVSDASVLRDNQSITSLSITSQ